MDDDDDADEFEEENLNAQQEELLVKGTSGRVSSQLQNPPTYPP